MDSFVTLKDVYKRYQMGEVTITASDGVSFEINKGEFAVVVGSSGAGKTTILNILGGMDSCDEGTILVDGKDIAKYNDKQLTEYRRFDIGFVFQFYNLVPNLTAKENVELATQISKDSLDPAEVLKEVGLGDRLDNFPAQLSGGEQQWVSIARALAKRPKLLLCDEPTGALDSRSSDELLRLFGELNRGGQTIVMVTHSVRAASTAGRVLFIKDGEVFHQLYRGGRTEEQFYQEISGTLTLLATGGMEQ